MPEKIFYICSGRSFRSGHLKPKIKGVVDSWQNQGICVLHLCAGDVLDGKNAVSRTNVHSAAPKDFHDKWYRRNRLMRVITHSFSEIRDIRCDQLMRPHIEKLIHENRPYLIWERSSRLAASGLQAAQKYNIPYVLEWKDHLVPYQFSLYHSRAVNLEKRKNREADFIVVESEKLLRDLAAEGVDESKIFVAHNAVDPDQFMRDDHLRKAMRDKYDIADNTLFAGYLGSYAFYHDTIRLPKAVLELKKRGVQNIKILMVGSGKEYSQTRRYAQDNRLDSHILFLPWVPKEEVPGILSALDVGILPGCTDIICPIKIQEYMAMELATIAPDYACNHEVIRQEQDGLLFEPFNEKSLADALEKLAAAPPLREKIGQNARQRVIDHFTWEKTWGRVLQEIMDEIATKKD